MENLIQLVDQNSFQSNITHCGELNSVKHFGQTGHLHVLESGQIRILSKGQPDLLMDRPSMVLIPAALNHRIAPVGEKAAMMMSSSISFSSNLSPLLLKALPEYIYTQLSVDSSVACTARWLLKEMQAHRFAKTAMISKLSDVFILQILRHATEQGCIQQGTVSAINHPQLSKVIHELHRDPGSNWTLDNLASLAAMSRSKFAEQFKQFVGQTPNTYITNLRLNLAKNLLKANKSINYVASEVGYEHASALARIFKKRLGVSPKQWKKQLNTGVSNSFSV